jgi:Ger(x)C family germination protein
MFNKKTLYLLIFTLFMYMFFKTNNTFVPIENIDIAPGVAVDVEERSDGNINYVLPISVYQFREDEGILLKIHPAEGKTVGDARQDRQLSQNKKFLLGLEQVFILGERFAKIGVNPWVEIVFANPNLNDTAYLTVTNEDVTKLLRMDIEGGANPSEYISEMLKSSKEFNFFSNNYKMMDMFIRIGSEGRNFVLPYTEIVNGNPKITGMAIFKGDKMVDKISIEDARAMNMMRENNVRGLMTIYKNEKKSIDFYGTSKRKVKCEKVDDKYKFYINIDYTGDIISNTINPEIRDNPKAIKEFEEEMAKQAEKECYDFIDKMKNELKTDCLELGMYAVAKTGRHTGIDWNEVVVNSEIEVKVKVKVDRQGRGIFT